jgi:hypothetical protein
MISPISSPMGVYNGHLRIGEIEELGKKRVIARIVTPNGLRPIGVFDDRRAAMLAVSEASREGEPEPPPQAA